MTVMVDKERVTRAFYDTLTPFEQGYTSYYQAAWPDAEIPSKCPYPAGSQNAIDFAAGELQAMIAVMDTEE